MDPVSVFLAGTIWIGRFDHAHSQAINSHVPGGEAACVQLALEQINTFNAVSGGSYVRYQLKCVSITDKGKTVRSVTVVEKL